MSIIIGVLAFVSGFFIAFAILKSKHSKLEIENIKLQEKIAAIQNIEKTRKNIRKLLNKNL